jgi:hypothetical protein
MCITILNARIGSLYITFQNCKPNSVSLQNVLKLHVYKKLHVYQKIFTEVHKSNVLQKMTIFNQKFY